MNCVSHQDKAKVFCVWSLILKFEVFCFSFRFIIRDLLISHLASAISLQYYLNLDYRSSVNPWDCSATTEEAARGIARIERKIVAGAPGAIQFHHRLLCFSAKNLAVTILKIDCDCMVNWWVGLFHHISVTTSGFWILSVFLPYLTLLHWLDDVNTAPLRWG